MCSMFSGCSLLKELNLNNFNTTNVTNFKFNIILELPLKLKIEEMFNYLMINNYKT